MNQIIWSNVSYNDKEQKLIILENNLYDIPDAIINLYNERVKLMDISFNKLININGIELFYNLNELILDNNRLNELSLKFNKIMYNIKILSLNNNKFTNLDILINRLNHYFPNLEYLSLLGNPVCPDQINKTTKKSTSTKDYDGYRNSIQIHLKKLKFLDSCKITREFDTSSLSLHPTNATNNNNNDVISDNLNKHFNKIKMLLNINLLTKEKKLNYNPLPIDNSKPGRHRGVYGRCKYKYVGAHSEGNRFIMNQDL